MKKSIYALLLCLYFPLFLFSGLHKAFNHADTQNHIQCTTFKYPLGVAVIFRDEAPYLKEWIEYYRMLGVERFYFYNNRSQDHYATVLKPYIEEGIAVLIDWPYTSVDVPSWNAVQCLAYRDAITRALADRVKWLALLDADEFLVPRYEDSLLTFLDLYDNDNVGEIRVHWVMFGTSCVDKIPEDKLLIETLLLNEGYVSGMWKSVVRPARVYPFKLGGPHTQPLKEGFEMPLLSTDEIQCNHYWSRDEHYLNTIKIPRRLVWGTTPEECEAWKDSFNKETDASLPILRFIPELKIRLKKDS